MNMIPRSFRRAQFREERFRTYVRPIIDAVISKRGSCRILDLGGDADYWQFDLPASSVEIWLLNIEARQPSPDADGPLSQWGATNAMAPMLPLFDVLARGEGQARLPAGPAHDVIVEVTGD